MARSKSKRAKAVSSSTSTPTRPQAEEAAGKQSSARTIRAFLGGLVAAFAAAAVAVWGTGAGQKISEALSRSGDAVKVATQVLPQDADMHIFKDPLILTDTQLRDLNALEHSSDAYAAWFSTRHSVPAGSLDVRVVLIGNRDHELRVLNVKPVSECSEPLSGTLFDSPPAGGQPAIDFKFNLDKPSTKVQYRAADGVEKADYFHDNTISLKDGEQAIFTMTLHTVQHYCRVKFSIEIFDGTTTFTQEFNNQGVPFEVSAVQQSSGVSQYQKYQAAYVGGVLAPRTAPLNSSNEAGWTRVQPPVPSPTVGSADCLVAAVAGYRKLRVDTGETSTSCDIAKAVIGKYQALPLDGAHGNMNVRDVDGWTCYAPTASTSQAQNIAIGCERGSERIVVRPDSR